jgi:hypothetical protein
MVAFKRRGGGMPGNRLPRAVKFVLTNAALGSLIGGMVGALLIYTNVSGLFTLIEQSSDPVTPIVLMVAGFSSLIGGLYAGAAIMRLPPGD